MADAAANAEAPNEVGAAAAAAAAEAGGDDSERASGGGGVAADAAAGGSDDGGISDADDEDGGGGGEDAAAPGDGAAVDGDDDDNDDGDDDGDDDDDDDDDDEASADASGDGGVEDYWPVNADNLLRFPRRAEIMKTYFMGGLARYQAMHAFLRKLHALNDVGENGDDKPLVQFRVLTRGYASSTNDFLNDTELKRDGGAAAANGPRFIHSVWDTHGRGYDAADADLEFDHSVHGEASNKLDMIEVFAAEAGAGAVLFAEDMRNHDRMEYEEWIERHEAEHKDKGTGFACKLIPLPYEAEGLSPAQLREVLTYATERQAAGEAVLVVFDFDCTVTSFHFFKTLYWLRDRYHAAFLRWLPAEYFNDRRNKDRVMEGLQYSP